MKKRRRITDSYYRLSE